MRSSEDGEQAISLINPASRLHAILWLASVRSSILFLIITVKEIKGMQLVKQKRYCVDPATLPNGVELEKIERALERNDAQASGDGENSPGVVYPYHSGQKRYFVKDINVNLPAGVGVYIYVGTEQHAWAFLNDVSCNIFTNSAWYVKGVSIQSV